MRLRHDLVAARTHNLDAGRYGHSGARDPMNMNDRHKKYMDRAALAARSIKTSHIYPPIPDRRFDWCAYHVTDESKGYNWGWGATEQEAIEDLKRLDDERADYLEWKAEQARGICGND